MLIGILLFIAALASSNRKKRQALESLEEAHHDLTQSHQVDSERNLVLELVGRNESLDVILDLVAQTTQRREPDAMCAISVRKGDHLVQYAAPGLPAEFREATHVISIGKNATSCGAAATLGKLSIAEKFDGDPLWEHYQDVARRNNIQACFSTPLFSVTHEIIGTLALYWRKPRALAENDRLILESAGRLAAVAIEHRQLYDQLAFQAQHDSLTELPNRLLLHDRLKQALELAKRRKEKLGVFWLDLDRFKHVNDTLGHRAGDMLLRQVAQRLTSCVRASDTIARIGGDEFVLVASGLHEENDAQIVANKILTAMQEPFMVLEHQINVSGSVGVSLYPDHSLETANLIRHADAAMYVAKQAGKNTFHFFAPAVAEAADRRLEIEKRLRLAIQNSELELHYQPLVDADLKWHALEALLRWHSPELGNISPSEFIPVAEESGLISALGQWVLRRACWQAVEWRSQGLPPLRIAVNISSIEFERPDFVQSLHTILAETGADPALLELELTERVVMKEITDSMASLEEIRTLGVSISIDDFGTGYSSLSYLHYLTADSIKIDRSFIVNIAGDNRNTYSVVLAIIQMAHSMKMHVIAEGVETEDQMAALLRAGCDLMQGYLLARPMPAAAVEQQLLTIPADVGNPPLVEALQHHPNT